MDTNLMIIYLLPIVFMFHDFEEIIFFRSWLDKNKNWLLTRYPLLVKKMLPHFEKMSTAAFTFAVAEEFVLISAITLHAMITGYYYLWLCVFMAFFIHLVIHLVQWLFIRRYIPTIVTSVLCLPYCVYGLNEVLLTDMFRISDILLCSVIGFVFAAVNLWFVHKVAARIFN